MAKKPNLPSVDIIEGDLDTAAAPLEQELTAIEEAPPIETPPPAAQKPMFREIVLRLPIVPAAEKEFISRQVNVKLTHSQAVTFRAICNGICAAFPPPSGTSRARQADTLKHILDQIGSQLA